MIDRGGLRGADPEDAGPPDGGAVDADAVDADSVDADAVDADTIDADTVDADTIDADTVDADAGCDPADERCESNVRRYCEGGALGSEDCGAARHCDVTDGGPECVDNLCEPSTTRCSADGTEVWICDARGAGESVEACPRGCVSGACRPQTPCGAAIYATTGGGAMRVDLCGAGMDQTHTDACGWADQSIIGEDVLIRLEVDRSRPIRIQAHQVSSTGTVDPTLYLRSDCEDMWSEIWCREDTDGQDEDFTEDFDPGDYFLVIDRHQRSTTACGEVDVTITPL